MFRRRESQSFYFQFFTSCSLWYPYVQNLHRVPYLAFGTNFFPKNYNRQNTVNGRSSITSCAYLFISCNIVVDFWYCLACCILYSTKSKETSMRRSASAQVSLKYRQRIFYSLLRAYCFPNNFSINLVEKKFPIKGMSSKFTVKCLKCLDFK